MASSWQMPAAVPLAQIITCIALGDPQICYDLRSHAARRSFIIHHGPRLDPVFGQKLRLLAWLCADPALWPATIFFCKGQIL